MEIVPGMRSKNLYFKPINYPEIWDQYKGVYMSELYIIDDYMLEIANTGTDDPLKLYYILRELSEGMDMDVYYSETNFTYRNDPLNIIKYMIYARVLELGVWEAHFVTVGLISHYKYTLEHHANCLIYNESPIPLQMLPIACLYIEMLNAIKNNHVENYLNCNPSIRNMYADHPQLVSAMVDEIKNEPLPTTNYFSWAFEKASCNIEAQKKWPLYNDF